MELIDALFDLCKATPRPIIAIDGRAGAGKTTLAEHISAAMSLKYKCVTIHMDDLYNGWEDAFDHHISDSLIAACDSHQQGKQYSLSFFDWSKGAYREVVEIPQAELLILEGVGSSQKSIRSYLAATIWIEIDPGHGLERVLSRDGSGISEEMHKWLTTQEQHFRDQESEKAADFVLSN
jgi:uridine kinase